MTSKNITSLFDDLKNESQIFLNYLKAKFPIFHNSNLFSRDFQYGLKSFLEKKGIKISDNNLVTLSGQFSSYYETQGIFIKTSNQGWKLNYPDFITQKPGDPFSF
ncbi:MAG: hypothetical protein MUF28_03455 [Ignavibacterium sp.]|jgi:hypothetical protein|nr:hypothetical protein [Ignavibacterium sp.]